MYRERLPPGFCAWFAPDRFEEFEELIFFCFLIPQDSNPIPILCLRLNLLALACVLLSSDLSDNLEVSDLYKPCRYLAGDITMVR